MHFTKPATMITLFFCTGQGKNHYTTAAVDTILELLSFHHNVHIKRRWLFQVLRDFLDAGLIKRNPRNINDGNGLVSQIPSMIVFSLKGVVWLVKMGVAGAKEVHKAMLSYLNKGDARFPSRADYDDGSWRPENPQDRKRLESLPGIATEAVPKTGHM